MRVTGFLAICCLLAALPLAAQDGPQYRYRWTDPNGHVHLADNLPADAARLGYDLVNQYGRIVRHVDGDRTPEQIRAGEAKARAAKLAAAQELADRRMLLAYPTEEDLIAGQQERLRMLQLRIESTQLSMKSQIEGLAGLLDQAAAFAQRGKPVPAPLQKDIDHQRAVVRDQRVWIERRQAEVANTDAEFEQQLSRYRTLRNVGVEAR